MKRTALLAPIFITLFVMAFVKIVMAAGSTMYPWPTDWSPGSLASWSQPLIASGSALPSPAIASTGDLIFLYDEPRTATGSGIWRRDTVDSVATWVQVGGPATDQGVKNHSGLTELDYNSSGHTGFANSAGSSTADFNSKDFNAYGIASVALDIYEKNSKLENKYAHIAGSSTQDFQANNLIASGTIVASGTWLSPLVTGGVGIFIAGNGFIGIGISTPTYVLHIEDVGTVKIESILAENIQSTYKSSYGTLGINGTKVDLPWQFGVSTASFWIESGLIVGYSTPLASEGYNGE